MTELSKMLQEYCAGERGMPTYDELAALIDAPTRVRVFQSAEQNEQLARDAQAILDAEMLGIGFLVDGVSIHPSRVTVLRPAAAPQVVADERGLPPLPKRVGYREGKTPEYTADQMQTYARAAIAAVPVQAQEPVAIVEAKYTLTGASNILNRSLPIGTKLYLSMPDVTGKPFMYGIMGADGKAHMDEHCVAPDAASLYDELNCLNDSPDTDYSIVPLYRAPVQPVAVPDGPSAEDYSDMLRDFFFRYAAGGYNDDGGLVPLAKAKDKLQWVIDEEGKHAAPVAQDDAKELTDEQLTAALQGIYHSDFQDDSNGYDLAIARAAIAAKAAS